MSARQISLASQTFPIAAAASATTPSTSLVNSHHAAESPVEDDVQTPSAEHEPLPLAVSGFAPGIWASRPTAM